MSYASYEWFVKKDLSAYSGKWVAILEKKVVASDKDVARLITKVRKEHPSKRPMVTKVRGKLSIL